MSLKKTFIFIIIILIIDQVSKIYIKTNFRIQESVEVFSWFQIIFVENDGMAWGAKLSDFFTFMSDRTAKVVLTLFRIVAVTGIGYWMIRSIQQQASKILIIAVALIFSGALGNIIDSVFYGVVFNDSHGQVATLFAEDNYSSIFHGKVVDMLHFPMWTGTLPDWIPIWGGKAFMFFQPVFNIADVAISTGVGILIVFNKMAFSNKNKESKIIIE